MKNRIAALSVGEAHAIQQELILDNVGYAQREEVLQQSSATLLLVLDRAERELDQAVEDPALFAREHSIRATSDHFFRDDGSCRVVLTAKVTRDR